MRSLTASPETGPRAMPGQTPDRRRNCNPRCNHNRRSYSHHPRNRRRSLRVARRHGAGGRLAGERRASSLLPSVQQQQTIPPAAGQTGEPPPQAAARGAQLLNTPRARKGLSGARSAGREHRHQPPGQSRRPEAERRTERRRGSGQRPRGGDLGRDGARRTLSINKTQNTERRDTSNECKQGAHYKLSYVKSRKCKLISLFPTHRFLGKIRHSFQ